MPKICWVKGASMKLSGVRAGWQSETAGLLITQEGVQPVLSDFYIHHQ